MAHDVFVSHSSKDKITADAVCATLEGKGIRCWVAPRDILAGADWGESIIDAISCARVMVLILSSNSNISKQVMREVERAVNKETVIIPMRVEDIPLSKSLEYFLSTAHWFDAFTPPLNKHLDGLADSVEQLISADPAAKQNTPVVPAVRPQSHRRQNWGIGTKAVLVLVTLLLIAGTYFAFRGGTQKQSPQNGAAVVDSGINESHSGENLSGDGQTNNRDSDQPSEIGDTKLLGPNSPRMTVEHFRVDPTGIPERLGRIGTGTHQPIQMNDVVRLSLDLDRPQHVLLVAFNSDGSVQLCFPEDETTAPAAIQHLEYPSESDLYFGLTDGRGQQAFLVFVSPEPLPAFANLRKDIEAAGWTTNTMGGLWRFDGSKVSQVFESRTDRGTVQRLTTPQFRSLCTSLVKQPSMGRVFGVAFPVE